MVARVSFTAVYEPVENGWIQAHLAELPGVITAAPTLEEAKELLADSLREYLLALGGAEGPPTAAVAEGSRQAASITIVIDAA